MTGELTLARLAALTMRGNDENAGVTERSADQAAAYNRRVGELLRDVRRQRGLSLQEVEARTGAEFRASVVGAYERGERALSLARLARLAGFYEVPVGRLLPGSRDGATVEVETPPPSGRLTIDMPALSAMPGDPYAMLAGLLRTLQRERQDLRSERIAVRSGDRPAIAAILDVPLEELDDRLALAGLLVRPD